MAIDPRVDQIFGQIGYVSWVFHLKYPHEDPPPFSNPGVTSCHPSPFAILRRSPGGRVCLWCTSSGTPHRSWPRAFCAHGSGGAQRAQHVQHVQHVHALEQRVIHRFHQSIASQDEAIEGKKTGKYVQSSADFWMISIVSQFLLKLFPSSLIVNLGSKSAIRHQPPVESILLVPSFSETSSRSS